SPARAAKNAALKSEKFSEKNFSTALSPEKNHKKFHTSEHRGLYRPGVPPPGLQPGGRAPRHFIVSRNRPMSLRRPSIGVGSGVGLGGLLCAARIGLGGCGCGLSSPSATRSRRSLVSAARRPLMA